VRGLVGLSWRLFLTATFFTFGKRDTQIAFSELAVLYCCGARLVECGNEE